MSAFNLIHKAIVAELLAGIPLADGRIYRGRRGPLPAEHNSMVAVRLEATDGESSGIGSGPTDWRTRFAIECHARGSGAQAADDAVDALLSDVQQRVAALRLPELGVMALVLNPEIEWEYAEHETELVAATLRLTVIHRTAGADFTPWS